MKVLEENQMCSRQTKIEHIMAAVRQVIFKGIANMADKRRAEARGVHHEAGGEPEEETTSEGVATTAVISTEEARIVQINSRQTLANTIEKKLFEIFF